MSFTSKNPDFRETVLQKMEVNHFMHHIGFKVLTIEPGYIEGELIIEHHHQQQFGFVHGGVTSTLSDLVMGFAAYTLVPEGEGTVTSDLHVSYLRPGTGVKVIAKGKVVKPGNLLYYCEADIVSVDANGSETLMARATSTMCAVKHK